MGKLWDPCGILSERGDKEGSQGIVGVCARETLRLTVAQAEKGQVGKRRWDRLMGTAQAVGDSAGRRGTARAAVCISEVLPRPPMGIGLRETECAVYTAR